jgi:quercetin dioxygenase-like cupin family protein
VTADPNHYAIEFENDAVRVLRIRYGPGETSAMHTHPATCSVALTDASWRMTDAEGNVTDEDPTTMGQVACGNEPSVHSPENTGSAASELILVEFKEGVPPGTWSSSEPDAVTGDPDHHTVEWENDVLRVLRISYGAGEQSVMHHHPANCVIPMNDGLWHMTNATGEVTEMQTSTGQLLCGTPTYTSRRMPPMRPVVPSCSSSKDGRSWRNSGRSHVAPANGRRGAPALP